MKRKRAKIVNAKGIEYDLQAKRLASKKLLHLYRE